MHAETDGSERGSCRDGGPRLLHLADSGCDRITLVYRTTTLGTTQYFEAWALVAFPPSPDTDAYCFHCASPGGSTFDTGFSNGAPEECNLTLAGKVAYLAYVTSGAIDDLESTLTTMRNWCQYTANCTVLTFDRCFD